MSEEIYELTLHNVNMLANIKNWCRLLDVIIPDDMIVGRITKATKRDIIDSIQSSVRAILENNAEIQRFIKEKDS